MGLIPAFRIHVGLSLHFRFDQNICKILIKCFCAHACKNLHQKLVVKIRTHWANKIHASNFARIVHEFLSGRTTGNLQPATKSDASHLVKNCPSSPFPMNLYLDTGCAGHSSHSSHRCSQLPVSGVTATGMTYRCRPSTVYFPSTYCTSMR